MEIELTSTRVNPLIGRKEVEFLINAMATPRRFDVRSELARMLKAELDTVWLRKLETGTGTRRVLGLAHVYDDAAKAIEVETKHIIRRNQPIIETTEESGEGDEQ